MNHYMEASVSFHIVKLALAIGIENLRLGGDSLHIIIFLKDCSHPSWIISNMVEGIPFDLGKFKRVHVSEVYREANSVVD